MDAVAIDPERALAHLLRFLAIDGASGKEGGIGREIVAALAEIGVPEAAMRFDNAAERIPLPAEAGNLIVDVEGREGGERRLFAAHRDTVPLCVGAQPRHEGDRIVSAAPTALGGDDRAGVACLITMVGELRRRRLSHPPLTLLFTVHEETGAWGARTVRVTELGAPELAFNLDGATPSRLVIGAVGAARWEAEVTGRAAHAGLHPERGISAALVAAEAIAAARRNGWWGRIRRAGGEGTANVGRLAGRDGAPVGGPNNVVTDYTAVTGEARSHDGAFISTIVAAYRRAFERAAARLGNQAGERARVDFRSERMFEPFRLPDDAPVVRFAGERARGAGLSPTLAVADGGLDASWLVAHGLPTLTFGVGQREIHTAAEWVDLPDYLAACRLALALARS